MKLPDDVGDVQAWVDEQSELAAARFSKVVGEIVVAGVERYSKTLTAAGDIGALDPFDELFGRFMAAEFGEYLATMHLAGAAAASLTLPGAVPPSVMAGWLDVVNESAVVYQGSATNRIVGASADMFQDVRDRTVASVQSGESVDKLAEEVQAITGYAEGRAAAIARTETIGAFNGGEMEGARALAEYGPTHKEWSAALDRRTREDHAFADGQVVPIDEPFVVGGELMDRPVDPAGSAANVVNCRCTVLFLYPGDVGAERVIPLGDGPTS